jgi:hypothetical protein
VSAEVLLNASVTEEAHRLTNHLTKFLDFVSMHTEYTVHRYHTCPCPVMINHFANKRLITFLIIPL